IERKFEASVGSSKQIEEQFKKIKSDFFQQAQNSMEKALKAAPDSATLHAKEAILLAEFDKDYKKELSALDKIEIGESTKTNEKSADANGVAKDRNDRKQKTEAIDEKTKEKAKKLLALIRAIYIERKIAEPAIADLRKDLKEYIPPGWYRDV